MELLYGPFKNYTEITPHDDIVHMEFYKNGTLWLATAYVKVENFNNNPHNYLPGKSIG